MRLTDADALKAESQKRQEGIERYGEEQADCFYSACRELSTEWWCVEDMIDNAPTIDAVPVVRCKDCKHRPIDTGGHNYGQDLFFPDEDNVCPCQCGDQWYSWMPGDDWFCANGERED